MPHALVSGEYAARRAECEEAARLLGVPALGLVTDPAAVERLADPVLRRRARHVVTDSIRARAIAAALQDVSTSDSYPFTGKLLTEGHASLRDDFEVSWPQADVAVDVAIEAGAYGAKMIGGGFGGSVLALMPAERVPAVRVALEESFVRRAAGLPRSSSKPSPHQPPAGRVNHSGGQPPSLSLKARGCSRVTAT